MIEVRYLLLYRFRICCLGGTDEQLFAIEVEISEMT